MKFVTDTEYSRKEKVLENDWSAPRNRLIIDYWVRTESIKAYIRFLLYSSICLNVAAEIGEDNRRIKRKTRFIACD